MGMVLHIPKITPENDVSRRVTYDGRIAEWIRSLFKFLCLLFFLFGPIFPARPPNLGMPAILVRMVMFQMYLGILSTPTYLRRCLGKRSNSSFFSENRFQNKNCKKYLLLSVMDPYMGPRFPVL